MHIYTIACRVIKYRTIIMLMWCFSPPLWTLFRLSRWIYHQYINDMYCPQEIILWWEGVITCVHHVKERSFYLSPRWRHGREIRNTPCLSVCPSHFVFALTRRYIPVFSRNLPRYVHHVMGVRPIVFFILMGCWNIEKMPLHLLYVPFTVGSLYNHIQRPWKWFHFLSGFFTES